MEKVVFGIMPSHYPGSYALVSVLADMVEGRLNKVDDARDRFPKNGEIYVNAKVIPEGFGRLSAGLWTVRTFETKSEEEEQSDRFARYFALGNLPAPHEIIPIKYSSEDQNTIRELLLNRVRLPYHLTSDALIEFTDGVVIGPVRALTHLDGDGFRCPENAFEGPIRAWRSRDAFNSLDISNNTSTRSFVQAKFIPKADFYIDLCPLQDSIRSIIKLMAKEGPGSYVISRKDQERLAEKLSSGGLPEQVEARRERVLRLLRQSMDMPEQLDAAMKIILEHPKIKERLESEDKRAFESGQQRLTSQEAGLHKRIADLVIEERRMKRDLEDLTSRIKGEEERGLRQVNELEQTIRARALKAKEEVGALLAEVAILQPFFGSNGVPRSTQTVMPSPTQTSEPVTPVEFREWEPRDKPKSFPEAVTGLQRNLSSLGLLPISARAFARDVVAAVLCRQLVLFQGSLGGFVARVVARTLACRRVTTFRVPVGFGESVQLESLLRQAVSQGECAAFIIEGVNRSCIDAYGTFLTETISDRIFGLGDPLPNLILLGNVLDGPSALPPGAGLTSLGPIFHTDCLAWRSTPPESKLVDGQLIALPKFDRVVSPEESVLLDKWGKALCGTPSVLCAKNVALAFKALSVRPETGNYPSPLESVNFGWLLPRAIAMGVDLGDIGELLDEVRKDAHVQSLLRDILRLPASQTS